MSSSPRCPCGTGVAYDECCGPLHDGERSATTAEQLMRSRFSAFALHLVGYLESTRHPSTRPSELDLFDDATEWRRLHIVDTERGGGSDDAGVVEFVARWRRGGEGGSMRERSRFVREHGRWYYLDGDQTGPGGLG